PAAHPAAKPDLARPGGLATLLDPDAVARLEVEADDVRQLGEQGPEVTVRVTPLVGAGLVEGGVVGVLPQVTLVVEEVADRLLAGLVGVLVAGDDLDQSVDAHCCVLLSMTRAPQRRALT